MTTVKTKNPEKTSFAPHLADWTDAKFKDWWKLNNFEGDYKFYHASIKAGKCDYVKAPAK